MRIDQMRVIKFSDATNQLNQVIDQVVDEGDFTIISCHDAQDAVVMSLDTFNSIKETLYLLRSPANAAHLTRSLAQHRWCSDEPLKSPQTFTNT
jgi:antitoxin YefM